MTVETIGVSALMLFMIGQLYTINKTLGELGKTEEHQDEKLNKLSNRTHEHAQTLQQHEGRISSLEQRSD